MKKFGPIGASSGSMSPPVWLLPGPDPWKGVGYFFLCHIGFHGVKIFCVCVCACMFMGVLVCILGDPGGTLSKLPSSRVLDFSSAVSVRSSPKKNMCCVSCLCADTSSPSFSAASNFFLFPRGNLPLAPPLSVGVLGMVSERVFHPLGSPWLLLPSSDWSRVGELMLPSPREFLRLFEARKSFPVPLCPQCTFSLPPGCWESVWVVSTQPCVCTHLHGRPHFLMRLACRAAGPSAKPPADGKLG